ncbi:MAG TPA: prephenate dehydrogenase/arogenate dehydrogenase family protein [Candidatus Saccharimonadales bacterium]|jgi:prephenate dehydrogenase|nr:prephenate dehydrogenase/arogenate dehydrogenase family protein [Candidatus Saccharimonadales bacterium]
MAFKQITIIGTGLIGGSFGMAVKAAESGIRIVGCDRSHVLEQALKMGAIDHSVEDPLAAVQGSDLVLLATPVGMIIDLLERIGPVVVPEALITDTGSTKQEILNHALAVFGAQAGQRFLGGHPMAGKEHSGILSADSGLFRNATWLLVRGDPQQDMHCGRIPEYRQLLQSIGARVTEIGADRQDQLCAWVSHLPQMISTALAAMLVDEFGDDPDLQAIGGRALREMTRIASSPYSMWRDVAHTNSRYIERALARMEQSLAHLRENLKTPELREEFERANRFGLPRPPGGHSQNSE